ncbi:hypothetical protein [Escherichia coli]|uniref:hypothetical protein n=1 Tax=Escherichia coli TaxID=562 RepID=UPI003D9C9627
MLIDSQNDVGDGYGLQDVIHDSAVAVVLALHRAQAGVNAGVFVPHPRDNH